MRINLLVWTLAASLIVQLGSERTGIAQSAVTVQEWTFDTAGNRERWSEASGVTDIVVRDGVLRGVISGRDPFISISDLDIPARRWNVFQARLRIVQVEPLSQQQGELFYANSNVGPYAGFSQEKSNPWTAPEANTWEVIAIYPFWSEEKKIIKLRLDFPAPTEEQIGKAIVEIDWIKISDLKLETQSEIKPSWTIEGGQLNSWDSPMFSLDTKQIGSWLTIDASWDTPRPVEFSWMNDLGDFNSTIIELDGNSSRLVNIDLANSKYWQGRIHQFKLRALSGSKSPAAVTFRSVAVNPSPQGPAHICVMIWSPAGMDNDILAIEKAQGRELKKGHGVKQLLDLSQEMAKEAGFEGIYFVAMKFPEASTDAADIQWLADAGFEMTSIYHFMEDGGKASDRRKFDFELVVEASKPFWECRNKTGILPFLPNLSTGWDDRPWNDHRWIAERTPAKFAEICRKFREFSKESGIKRALLAPVNEWGEGSYAEPCREFGFGMYEAIRDNLCERPESGWPLNYGPKDVGLGPYEYTDGAKY